MSCKYRYAHVKTEINITDKLKYRRAVSHPLSPDHLTTLKYHTAYQPPVPVLCFKKNNNYLPQLDGHGRFYDAAIISVYSFFFFFCPRFFNRHLLRRLSPWLQKRIPKILFSLSVSQVKRFHFDL